ncbi:MAG TPA: type II secretion system protein GspJ [Kofleriaceae bacterium]|nr:type II secretion system protein GspJ [Kofleriaceae bacterium]
MRRSQAGMTLLEVMIASAIMVVMMTLAWKTISNTNDARRSTGVYAERNHELRMALGRISADFEHAYLSKNEDINATHPRTLLVGKSGSKVPDIHVSTLGHRVLWADANESEQTIVSYMAHNSKETPGQTDLIRSERRRPSNLNPDEEPAEYDVLVRDIDKLELQYWNWKNLEWQDTWDTTQSDGQRGFLPTRVKITITVKAVDGRDIKLTTQARISMQEALIATP